MSKDEQIALLKTEKAVLEQQVAWLKKQLFGSGKSEKLDKNQILLELQLAEAELKEEEEPVETITYQRKKSKKQTKEASYDHLPILETEVIEPEEVKAEPDAFEKISEEKTFEVKIDPPKFFRKEIIRPKYRRKDDVEQSPVIAAAPARPVHGVASTSLLVYILISKYADHLPLYRQEKMYKRYGCEIARSSMARWIGRCTDLLKPIYSVMHQTLIDGDYLQIDETPIKVLEPDMKLGKARQAYLWPISKPDGDIVFTWSVTRSASHIEKLLGTFTGYLQCDGYKAYESYCSDKQITQVSCLAHIRRKFFEARSEKPSELLLDSIRDLYKIEAQLREAKADPEQIYQIRQTTSKPLFVALKKQLVSTAAEVLPQSLSGKACHYALGQWNKLAHYLEDGRIQIDNNLIENAIRPSAIGKKNWIFIGHPQAGERSAIIYSLIISCQRIGVDPSQYLESVLNQMPSLTNRDCSHLTPQNWAKQNTVKERQKV